MFLIFIDTHELNPHTWFSSARNPPRCAPPIVLLTQAWDFWTKRWCQDEESCRLLPVGTCPQIHILESLSLCPLCKVGSNWLICGQHYSQIRLCRCARWHWVTQSAYVQMSIFELDLILWLTYTFLPTASVGQANFPNYFCTIKLVRMLR